MVRWKKQKTKAYVTFRKGLKSVTVDKEPDGYDVRGFDGQNNVFIGFRFKKVDALKLAKIWMKKEDMR